MTGLLNPFTTGNPFFLGGGTKLLRFSIGRGSGALNPFTTGNPFLGTKLLGFSIGRGSGALKGSTPKSSEKITI